MSLKDKIPDMLNHISAHRDYLDHNAILLDIYDGNLKEYVESDLKKSLSIEYFSKIQSRIIPINILKRLIDKLGKTYAKDPIRTAVSNGESNNKSDQELVEFYEEKFQMNTKMNSADEYSFLTKGYALELFLHKGEQKLRVIAYDKFLPFSDDPVDPTAMTAFIKFMGMRDVEVIDRRSREGVRLVQKEVFFVTSDDEFIAFDIDGEIYQPAMEDNEGVNPFGIIPQVYGSRANDKLIPIQDSDLLAMTKVIPVILSDISGAILFQCFSIIWGIDIDFEEMKLSPNAIWSLKSDKTSDKQPVVGTLKPEADIEKVMMFVINVFTFWLETKGIKVGSVGNMDGASFASGISKIIDEMDTTDLRKTQVQAMKRDEKDFWHKLAIVHNQWVESGQIKGMDKFSDGFSIVLEFDEPKTPVGRDEEVTTKKLEVESGFLDPETAIKELYPDLTEEQVKVRLEYFNSLSTIVL